MRKQILSGALVVISLVAFVSMTSPLAFAYSEDPSGCFINAVTLGITAFRANGVTPIGGGTVVAGETIKYQAFLSTSGYPNCYYQNGTVHIHLPNGTQVDVTPPSGIPEITTLNSPFSSLQSIYVVDSSDVDGSNHLIALAHYMDGISLTPTAPSTANAETSFPLPFEAQSLIVAKNATPAIQQTYTWTIDKGVTPASWTLVNGQTGTSQYTISVVKTLSGTVNVVSGTITITNPSAFVPAHITGVADVISPALGANVNCPVSLPYDLAAGAQLVCTYSATLPDTANRTNTVNVATTGDIGGGSGAASVDFTGVTPTVVGGSINVDDTYNSGTWAFSNSGSVNYPRTFDCRGLTYDDSGHANYCRTNTATIRGTQLSDDATVCVHCSKPFAAPSMSPLVMIFLVSALVIICLIKIRF